MSEVICVPSMSSVCYQFLESAMVFGNELFSSQSEDLVSNSTARFPGAGLWEH